MQEVAWLPGDRLVASQMIDLATQHWWLHPRGGSAVQLTPDLSAVRGVQLTADRTAGVTTRTIARASIAVGTVTSRTFVQAFAPSTAEPMSAQLDAAGGLLYTARVPGSIATFRGDGTGGAGTLVAQEVAFALPSPDGRFVVGRRPNGDLVRVNADGSGLVVLLSNTAEINIPAHGLRDRSERSAETSSRSRSTGGRRRRSRRSPT